MRKGSQNKAIGANPIVFPNFSLILEQLYTGAYSGVINASKFFYQFPTWADKRKYLGCIHPRWDDHFHVYAGLPLGPGNSPTIAGQYGTAFAPPLAAFQMGLLAKATGPQHLVGRLPIGHSI
jgi:hypothetical protein